LNPDVLLWTNVEQPGREDPPPVRAEIRKLQKNWGSRRFMSPMTRRSLTLSDRIAVVDHGNCSRWLPRISMPSRNPFVADFIGINNLIPGSPGDSGREGKMKVTRFRP